METYTLSYFPPEVRIVHIALIHNLTNATEIRKKLMAAATTQGPEGDTARQEVDFGFIEVSLICSKEHLLTAIQTTLLNSLNPSSSSGLTTRSHNIHSEILLTLSPNNNITDSIRRHGLSDKTTELVIVRIEPELNDQQQKTRQEGVWREMERVVKGDLVGLDELDKGFKADWSRIDKAYKLNEMNALKIPAEELLERKKAAVVTTVAVKSVT